MGSNLTFASTRLLTKNRVVKQMLQTNMLFLTLLQDLIKMSRYKDVDDLDYERTERKHRRDVKYKRRRNYDEESEDERDNGEVSDLLRNSKGL